ncbi:hypothetical protein CspHIS471_0605610 [Cutaneotrichosporon sp. HIS471]|nr:hypothetical protein CspHIS471_0605610 [Cutaneotrichosporon sp. HIS471]
MPYFYVFKETLHSTVVFDLYRRCAETVAHGGLQFQRDSDLPDYPANVNVIEPEPRCGGGSSIISSIDVLAGPLWETDGIL